MGLPDERYLSQRRSFDENPKNLAVFEDPVSTRKRRPSPFSAQDDIFLLCHPEAAAEGSRYYCWCFQLQPTHWILPYFVCRMTSLSKNSPSVPFDLAGVGTVDESSFFIKDISEYFAVTGYGICACRRGKMSRCEAPRLPFKLSLVIR